MAFQTHRFLSAPAADHIPVLPPYFTIIRFIQVLLAVVILGLSSYSVTGLTYGGGGYAIFVSLATLIIVCYSLVTSFNFARFYNRIAVLVLEFFSLVWWLACWTSLAAWASVYDVGGHFYSMPTCDIVKDVRYCSRKRSIGIEHWKRMRNALAAAAAFGAVEL
jgi:hypothetical protein